MKRFENAKAGDLVYCRKYGPGKIVSVYTGHSGGIECAFANNIFAEYTFDGMYCERDLEPMLFYRKGEDKYLTERPEPEIDWANVKRGTMFYAGDTENPSRICAFHIFDGEHPWFRSCTREYFDRIFIWKFSHPVNPSEVPYK